MGFDHILSKLEEEEIAGKGYVEQLDISHPLDRAHRDHRDNLFSLPDFLRGKIRQNDQL
ncbi:MAG: hypothetical protein ISR61_03365 [Desulfobacteraceae bacterium]|uniref:Uncharacterized protein n=1 Tax=Candidatus Desulfacyla euxinica TaxID=2841693 RepID=A0A8J6T429_9DELT|nr:hypothetical protein [Candidatus Desulfacyla euxinica]MBL6977961.1 hypothetical protein [Desulfobacteraceae bacterium]MBL7218267.1 hypothetical protein [Desulfobacteraceae bacterium]